MSDSETEAWRETHQGLQAGVAGCRPNSHPGYSARSRLFHEVQAIPRGPGYSAWSRLFLVVQAIPRGPGYSARSRLFHVVQAIPRGPGYSVWSRLFHEVHAAEATTSPGSLIEMWTLSPNPDFWIKACIFTGSPSDSH